MPVPFDPEAFYAHLLAAGRKPSTAAQYTSFVRQILAHVAVATTDAVRQYLDQTYAISGRPIRLSAWRAYLDWAHAPASVGAPGQPPPTTEGREDAARREPTEYPEASIAPPPLWHWHDFLGPRVRHTDPFNPPPPGGPPFTGRHGASPSSVGGSADWRQRLPRKPISEANAAWSIVQRLGTRRFSRAFLLQLAFITDGWLDLGEEFRQGAAAQTPLYLQKLAHIDAHIASMAPFITVRDPGYKDEHASNLAWLATSLGRPPATQPGQRPDGQRGELYVVPPFTSGGVPYFDRTSFASTVGQIIRMRDTQGVHMPPVCIHALRMLAALPCRSGTFKGRAATGGTLLAVLPYLSWLAIRFQLPSAPPPAAIAQTTIQEKAAYLDADWDSMAAFIDINPQIRVLDGSKRFGEAFPWAYTAYGPEAVGPFLMLLAAGQWTIDEISFGAVPVVPVVPGQWEAGSCSARSLTTLVEGT